MSDVPGYAREMAELTAETRVQVERLIAERDAAQVKAAAALVALGLASEEVRELRERCERYEKALRHIEGQATVLIGNPYGSFARAALRGENADACP